jgi:hypothetical protein
MVDDAIRDIRAAVFSLPLGGQDVPLGLRAQVVAVAEEMTSLLGLAVGSAGRGPA